MTRSNLRSIVCLSLLGALALPAGAAEPVLAGGSAGYIENRAESTAGRKIGSFPLGYRSDTSGLTVGAVLCNAEAFDRGEGRRLRFVVNGAFFDARTSALLAVLPTFKVVTKKKTGLGEVFYGLPPEAIGRDVIFVGDGRIQGGKKVDHVKLLCIFFAQ